MNERRPVADWATDWDHLTDEWATQCTDIWAELRERCPVAHTDRYHGAYLVTRYDDAVAVAHDPTSFSSRVTFVNENPPEKTNLNLPPVTRDPPDHSPIRRALLPAFNPRKVAELEPLMVDIVDGLLDKLCDRTVVDAVHDFA
jgi:cytochrome P450